MSEGTSEGRFEVAKRRLVTLSDNLQYICIIKNCMVKNVNYVDRQLKHGP